MTSSGRIATPSQCLGSETTLKLGAGHIEDEEVQEIYWDGCRNAQQMCIE